MYDYKLKDHAQRCEEKYKYSPDHAAPDITLGGSNLSSYSLSTKFLMQLIWNPLLHSCAFDDCSPDWKSFPCCAPACELTRASSYAQLLRQLYQRGAYKKDWQNPQTLGTSADILLRFHAILTIAGPASVMCN
jgi:hypothetical protein